MKTIEITPEQWRQRQGGSYNIFIPISSKVGVKIQRDYDDPEYNHILILNAYYQFLLARKKKAPLVKGFRMVQLPNGSITLGFITEKVRVVDLKYIEHHKVRRFVNKYSHIFVDAYGCNLGFKGRKVVLLDVESQHIEGDVL